MTSLVHNFLSGSLGGFTHTRGTVATVKDFENVIKTVPVNIPAFSGMRVVTNLTPDPESETLWEANGTNPPTLGASVEYLGKTALATLTFDDTMTITGYAGCRGDAGNGDGYSQIVEDREYRHSVEIALSRNLVSGEQITFYSTGTSGSPGFAIDENNDFEDWTIITANIHIPSGTGVNFPVFYMQENINPGNDPVILYIRNCMTEEVTGQTNQNPSSYVNGTAFYDYENGNTLSSNIVTEAEGAVITGITGLQVEGARVNLLIESEDITAAGGWSSDGSIVLTADQAVSPDGATTAELIDLSVGGDAYSRLNSTVTNTEDYAISRYYRSVTGTGTYTQNWLSSAGSHNRELINLTETWERFFQQATASSSNLYTYSGDNRVLSPTLDQAYAWGAQVELGGFASSYIATSGATVTRNATSVTQAFAFPSNNFTFTFIFTVNFDHDDVKGASDVQLLLLDDGTANNVLDITVDATNDQIHLNKTVSGGSAVTASTTATDLNYSRGDKITVVGRCDSTGIHITVNNLATVTTTTGDGPAPWATLMDTITIQPGFIDVESLSIKDLHNNDVLQPVIGNVITDVL